MKTKRKWHDFVPYIGLATTPNDRKTTMWFVYHLAVVVFALVYNIYVA